MNAAPIALLLLTSFVPGQHDGNGIILPASMRTRWGNSYNYYGIGRPNQRFQEVFHGLEVGAARTLYGHGYRNNARRDAGGTQQLEIKLSVSKIPPSLMSATFAWNIGGPQTTVFKGSFTYPAMLPNTDVKHFQILVPWSKPWLWPGRLGENLLLEILNTSAVANEVFYYVDAYRGDSNVSRCYANSGPTSPTGTIDRSFGLVLCFVTSPLPPAGQFETFGAGCPGTKGNPGVVLPTSMQLLMGNSNNYYGVGRANMRYQQVFDRDQVGVGRQFLNHAYRAPWATAPGGVQNLEVRVSLSGKSAATLSTSFAANIDGAQTTVFKGRFDYPAMRPNANPRRFHVQIPWTTPWRWTQPIGKNLLVEIRNSSAASLLYPVDAHAGDAGTARLYSTDGVNATTGAVEHRYGLVFSFGYKGAVDRDPAIGNNGRPITGRSFDVTVGNVPANTAATLFMGFSKTKWGALSLPFDLTKFGAKGCSLLVSVDFVSGVATNASGTGWVRYAVPNDKGLWGLGWHNQWMVLDRGANALDLTFSNGGTVTIGGL